jgi:hypothetical protein
MLTKKISFDFDETLSEPFVQRYAKKCIYRGYDVWIVTSRLDAEHYNEHFKTPTYMDPNNDLYEVAKELGIKKDHIVFTNLKFKVEYFMKNPDFVWHLENDYTERNAILAEKSLNVLSIDPYTPFWMDECEKALKK